MHNNTKPRTVGLGRGILRDKFEKEQQGGNRAAIVLGPGILGKSASAKEQERLATLREPEKKTPEVKTPPTPKTATVKVLAARTPAPPKEKTAIRTKPEPTTPKAPAGMSETQARKLLAGDPNAWDKVLEVESARPGGVRPAVARAVLKLIPRMTENPLPDDLKADLEGVAGADSKKAAEKETVTK